MKKLVLATNNKNKVKEIREILHGLKLEIVTLEEVGINVDVEENGQSFIENALIKAREIARLLRENGNESFIVMADDSGLEVPYLNGEPGIYSARYAGIHGDDSANNEKLLSKLKGVEIENRAAFFVCAIALIDFNGIEKCIEGNVEGKILEEGRGCGGFGYDPLFFYEPFNRTFGELISEEKNTVSHRAMALKKLKTDILDLVEA